MRAMARILVVDDEPDILLLHRLNLEAAGHEVLLAADGKVYDIANQDFKDLEARAGQKVKMTGELKGTAITVSKIDPQ